MINVWSQGFNLVVAGPLEPCILIGRHWKRYVFRIAIKSSPDAGNHAPASTLQTSRASLGPTTRPSPWTKARARDNFESAHHYHSQRKQRKATERQVWDTYYQSASLGPVVPPNGWPICRPSRRPKGLPNRQLIRRPDLQHSSWSAKCVTSTLAQCRFEVVSRSLHIWKRQRFLRFIGLHWWKFDIIYCVPAFSFGHPNSFICLI